MWSTEETKTLIFYLEDNYQEYCGPKATFYRKCAEEIGKTEKQVKNKLEKLTTRYRETKTENEVSGNRRCDWEFFDLLDNIIGLRQNVTPTFLSSSSGKEKDLKKTVESTSSSPYALKRKRTMDIQKESLESKEKLTNAALEVEREKIKLQREELEWRKIVELQKMELQHEKLKSEMKMRAEEMQTARQKIDLKIMELQAKLNLTNNQ